MSSSADLKDRLFHAIDIGLEHEDPDVVAKFAGHALAFLRMFPVPVDEESVFKGPTIGALAKYVQPGGQA